MVTRVTLPDDWVHKTSKILLTSYTIIQHLTPVFKEFRSLQVRSSDRPDKVTESWNNTNTNWEYRKDKLNKIFYILYTKLSVWYGFSLDHPHDVDIFPPLWVIRQFQTVPLSVPTLFHHLNTRFKGTKVWTYITSIKGFCVFSFSKETLHQKSPPKKMKS